MKGTWLHIIMLLIFVGGASLLGGWMIFRGAASSSPEAIAEPPSVQEESEMKGIPVADPNTITLSSVIEPFEAIPISTKITSNITGLPVRDGSIVRKGQLLCTLDDTEIRLQIDSARLNLLRAENTLDDTLRERDSTAKTTTLALTRARQDLEAAHTRNFLEMQKAQDSLSRTQRELSEYESLLKAKAVSADDVRKKREAVEDARREIELLSTSQAANIAALEKAVEQAELDAENERVTKEDIQAYRIAVQNAREELENRRRRLADTLVNAPIGGTVRIIPRTRTSSSTATGQSAEKLGPGVRIYEGDPFLEIVTEQACCRIEVDEIDVARLSVGIGAKITGDAFKDQELCGEITDIRASGRKAAEGISLFPVIVLITSPLQDARMGMTADVTINLKQGDKHHE